MMLISSRRNSFQSGFTLIEVMLVIVIMAIMASLVVMNLQGVDQRKVMQARELLLLDLQKVRLESLDQARVLGLVISPATDIAKGQYHVVEYVKLDQVDTDQSQMSTIAQEQYKWRAAQDFQVKDLPDQASILIQPLDHQLNLDRLKQEQQLPQLIWLGNGEATPVSIQFYLQQQAVGDAIQLNRLGLVLKENAI